MDDVQTSNPPSAGTHGGLCDGVLHAQSRESDEARVSRNKNKPVFHRKCGEMCVRNKFMVHALYAHKRIEKRPMSFGGNRNPRTRRNGLVNCANAHRQPTSRRQQPPPRQQSSSRPKLYHIWGMGNGKVATASTMPCDTNRQCSFTSSIVCISLAPVFSIPSQFSEFINSGNFLNLFLPLPYFQGRINSQLLKYRFN